MPLVEIGFPHVDPVTTTPTQALVAFGPTIWVDIGLDSHFDYANPVGLTPRSQITSVPALVDTGAMQSCIDSALAAAIGLPVIDQQAVSGVGGVTMMNVYFGHIYFPAFGFSQWGRFAGVHLADGGQEHKALIGRTLLRDMLMVYDGRTGSVTLAW